MMLKRILFISFALISLLNAFADGPSCKEIADKVTAVAQFKTGEVNLRKAPSTTSPYLVRCVGDEMYFSPEDVCWSHQMGTQAKYEKQQAFQDERMPVLGVENGWVKLYYSNGNNPFEVWTMEKFVDILPLGEVTENTKFPDLEGSGESFTIKKTDSGELGLLYQEAGMDEEGSTMLIGEKVGKGFLLQKTMPIYLNYDEKLPQWSIQQIMGKGNGWLVNYGANDCNPVGSEYVGKFDFRNFTPQLFVSIYRDGKELKEDGQRLVLAVADGSGYVF